MSFWHQSEARTSPTVWNWSVKTLFPGGSSSRSSFSRPTNFPWVSENDIFQTVPSPFPSFAILNYQAKYHCTLVPKLLSFVPCSPFLVFFFPFPLSVHPSPFPVTVRRSPFSVPRSPFSVPRSQFPVPRYQF